MKKEYYPLIYIIVLSWNGKDDTEECLSSLKLLTYPNYSIIVVDNGSIDEILRYLFESKD